MFEVVATAPTRVDLAGGTIDLWPIHQQLSNAATVNFGIELPAQVTIRSSAEFSLESKDLELKINGPFEQVSTSDQLPLLAAMLGGMWSADLPPISICSEAKSPPGAGLGGSSTLAMALVAAFVRARCLTDKPLELSELEMVRCAQDVEARIIKAPTGVQDYWGAARGAINVISFPLGGERVETIDSVFLEEFEQRLIVCYSGQSRASAINNWEIFKRVFDKDLGLIDQLSEIGRLAERCAEAISNRDIEQVLAHSREEWNLRKKLWPNIETDVTRRLDQVARKAGAQFSRVCGAGGGGVMAFFCDEANRMRVELSLQENGGTVLAAKVARNGLHVQG